MTASDQIRSIPAYRQACDDLIGLVAQITGRPVGDTTAKRLRGQVMTTWQAATQHAAHGTAAAIIAYQDEIAQLRAATDPDHPDHPERPGSSERPGTVSA